MSQHQSHQIDLVCMGDSLTTNYGIDTDPWPSFLAIKNNLNVVNSGIPGDTSAGMLSRFNNDVLSYQPAYVSIMGGTNDIFLDVPIATIISHIHAMIRHARKKEMESIICIPPPFYLGEKSESLFLTNQECLDRMADYQNKLKQYCHTQELPHIDFSQKINAIHLLPDGVHPNENGHELMAQMMSNLMSNL